MFMKLAIKVVEFFLGHPVFQTGEPVSRTMGFWVKTAWNYIIVIVIPGTMPPARRLTAISFAKKSGMFISLMSAYN